MTGYVNTYGEFIDKLQKTEAVRSMNISIEDRILCRNKTKFTDNMPIIVMDRTDYENYVREFE